MSITNNVISRPVEIVSDIKTILGIDGDLKSLCQSSLVKMSSKYKPTDFPGPGFELGSDGIETFWRGNPKNGVYCGCGWSMSAMELNLSATVTTVNGHTMTLNNYLEGSVSYPYAILDHAAGALISGSSKVSPNIGRQTDFYRYTHNNPRYNYGNYPFRVSCSLPQSDGRNVIDAGAIVTYDYESIADGVGAWLGMKDLFCMETDLRMGQNAGASMTIGSNTGIRFFGVMVWCPRSGKSIIARSAITTVDNTPDTVSGNIFMRAVYFPISSVVDANGTLGFKYGDTVYVVPFILAKNVTPKYEFFAMNQFGNAFTSKALLDSSASPSYTNMHITQIIGTITCAYVSSRTFDIYFNANSNLALTCAGYSNIGTNRIFFTQDTLEIVPGDATGYVESLQSATLGSVLDSNSGYRYSSFSSNTGDGSTIVNGGIGYNYLRTRMRFTGTGTSAKVAVSIPVWQNDGNNGMIRKYFDLVFTINPRNTSTFTATASAS